MNRHWLWQPAVRGLLCLWMTLSTANLAVAQIGVPELPSATSTPSPGGPLRLRQAQPAPEATPEPVELRPAPPAAPVPAVTGEFERFVGELAGQEVRRLGSELVTGAFDGRGADIGPVVPPEYQIAPGDEVLVVVWGSIDADLRLTVDRSGRITVPRVGPIQVAGVSFGELQAVVERRVAQVFKNFQISVSLGQLRGIRVFVTGFVDRPGAYTVGALSTVVGALMRAGGPSVSGSFRQVELKRGGQSIGRFDLYDLLLKGDRSADRLIQSGDVVHVGPVGRQVGVIGSVNRPVVVELVGNEGVADALAMAGGFSAVADRSRVSIERLMERTSQRVAELAMPRDAQLPLSQGDVLRAFSSAQAVASTERQNKRIRVDGEVQRPGEYVLPPDSTLHDALRAAGGLSAAAFVYGTEFTRISVRNTQRENYERALRDLETDLARSSSSQRVSSGEQAARTQAQTSANARLIQRMRDLQPNGRVVLELETSSMQLPPLVIEDGDRLYVPPKPTTVGVFGSVFNTGSYLFTEGRSLDDYLRLAGGPTKGADEGSIFVVRANGRVISGRQQRSAWFGGSSGAINSTRAEPGDTVFVPEEMDKTTFVQAATDWTTILYQFGLGVAGLRAAIR